MSNADPRQRLLEDILDDGTSLEFRRRLLESCERVLQHRRRPRVIRILVPASLGLAAAVALVVSSQRPFTVQEWAGRRPATEVSHGASDRPAPKQLDHRTFVSTREILASSPDRFAEMSTTQIHAEFKVISDQELVRLLRDRGVALLGHGRSLHVWLGRDGELQAVR